LVLCGNKAIDDPESQGIFNKVMLKAKNFVRNGEVILITTENHILVNSLQRSSAVIIQKSLREGFGLSVTEALWKWKPVVASNVGGIPIQIKDGRNGFLVEPHDTEKFAEKIIEILQEPELAKEMGENGKEMVKEQFLITRLISDHFDILNDACNL